MILLLDDLVAEHAELDATVSQLDEDGWGAPTPAQGWTIRDAIAHLWYFDRVGARVVRDPEAFRREDVRAAEADLDAYMARPHELARRMTGAELLGEWRTCRQELIEAFRQIDPKTRLPWFGPAMGARSFVTARLMETWAHGQDVFDGLGLSREPTERLRHVAHIGVGARRFSYATRGLEFPGGEIRVELDALGGGRWSWGPVEAPDRVSGSALDFCLVATQRRHLADTGLSVQGRLATEWMAIAQAFAGPPGQGRQPGQFT